ncbi:MAG: NAD(P)H-dependent oxidoreductase subunit E [Anaerolineales bacterium]
MPLDLAPLQTYLDSIASRGRTMLLPALHKAHELYGWAPREVQETISQTLRVPLADLHGVIEFYSMFYNQPMPKRVVRLCEDPACHLAGAPQVAEALEKNLGQDTAFEHVTCLGMCDLAPAALNGPTPAGSLTPNDVPAFLAEQTPSPRANVYGTPRWLTARVGLVDPASLADYEQHGGYRGLRKAHTMTPDDLITFAEATGIVGRGGAMFPLGRKQRFTREASGSVKHIVVNADESEPGTFKDRVLMEEDPFSLIEAMTISAYGVGAATGWIFVRGEYPRSFTRLEEAVRQARNAGYLGKDILGIKGFNFDIELRLGAGAYICGEETALFEAIEGKRGFPRIKPPFPVTHGLFNQPTAIHNVETLVAYLTALNVGLDQWKAQGTSNSPGTKLFCLSGHVARPGLYEVPFGLTIGELIEMAGGVAGEQPLQAVLMGGAAGVIIGPEKLSTRLTYEDCRAVGIPMGSGVVMVFNQSVDLREILYQLARFFAHESCGKCFPCQLGTQRQMEILARVKEGRGLTRDRQTLLDVGFTMTETSLCGLGQTAASAVVSALNLWPELVETNRVY